MGTVTTHVSICRFCAAHCPIAVDMQDGRAVKVTGNKASPMFHGFCCTRGQATPEQLYSPSRLLGPLKRSTDGAYIPIASAQAVDEIADKLRAIVDRYGPSSVALYSGTYSMSNPGSTPLAVSFFQELGSPMMFNSGTIDQPGKHIANALMGSWEAGVHNFVESDVWMIIGGNPLVSIGITMPAQNPGWQLTEALRRGMKLIVVDPRETQTARRAHIHIQPRPGQDAALIAAMIHLIIDEGLYDKAFCDDNVSGIEVLRKAVAPFTPEVASARADVPREQIIEAARTFAKAKRGIAVGCTGANMSGRSSLTEYLILSLNTICGRYLRAGDTVLNPGVLLTRAVPKAQARPPEPAIFPDVKKMSVRNLSMSVLGMPTGALAEEILNGNIRALISLGGNPAAAVPDQNNMVAALQSLDLFVQLDIKMSASSKLAHYVVPPPISLELPAMSYVAEQLEVLYQVWGFAEPFGMFAPKLVDPPPGSDLLAEWELFYGLAQRLGLQLKFQHINSFFNSCQREKREPIVLNMTCKPTLEELFEMATRGSRIPLEEVKKHPNGALFPEDIRVAPKDPGHPVRLDVANQGIMDELTEVAREIPAKASDFPFTFIGRRMAHVYNSSGRDLPMIIRKGGTYNPAFMHPVDLQELGVVSGDVVKITSPHGSIHGIVEADDTVRRGLVSMSHSFGDLPREGADFRLVGSNTSQLTNCADDYDRYSGIPRMSGIPVQVVPSNRAFSAMTDTIPS
jgi:anaerobic selenocysteine-containing dehydrogenase